MLNIETIENKVMETDPFAWAFVDQLFTTEGALALAEWFPRDNFKKVIGYDGEKGYEYVARSLIHMGAPIGRRILQA